MSRPLGLRTHCGIGSDPPCSLCVGCVWCVCVGVVCVCGVCVGVGRVVVCGWVVVRGGCVGYITLKLHVYGLINGLGTLLDAIT